MNKALLSAAETGKTQEIKALMTRGANVNCKDAVRTCKVNNREMSVVCVVRVCVFEGSGVSCVRECVYV